MCVCVCVYACVYVCAHACSQQFISEHLNISGTSSVDIIIILKCIHSFWLKTCEDVLMVKNQVLVFVGLSIVAGFVG